jgi:hypothetical protein
MNGVLRTIVSSPALGDHFDDATYDIRGASDGEYGITVKPTRMAEDTRGVLLDPVQGGVMRFRTTQAAKAFVEGIYGPCEWCQYPMQ